MEPMKTISYSVIIPHFNDCDRLKRLLNSLPIHREDVEVIVVDDCSLDKGALEVVQACWPKVRWLSTCVNSGAGVARNVGLDAACGAKLLFADSDDEFLPKAFDTIDRVVQQDDELVYFLADSIQEEDGSPSMRSEGLNELVAAYFTNPSSASLTQLKLNHIVPWAKVYSHEFVKSRGIRFDAVQHGNDVAFNVLAAIAASRVRAVNIPVYRVYRRNGSLTSNLDANAFLLRFNVHRSVAQRLSKIGVRRVWSATGYMVLALRYGPGITLRVWSQAIFSPMLIEWKRVFDIHRWQRFFARNRRDLQEISK